MSHSKADTDGSIKLPWLVAIGFDNDIRFTFVDEDGEAFNVSDYKFSLQIRKPGAAVGDNLIEYTQADGITNNGVAGTVDGALNERDSARLKNRGVYFWQLTVVFPNGKIRRWYNGSIHASSEIHENTSTSAGPHTISLESFNITGTVSLVGGGGPKVIQLACSDETTAITSGTNKVKLRMPYAMIVTEVRASLSTAQASGNIFTVDINESGTTILSTKITIDNGEKTSTTAATPPVISDASLADDAEISIDVDQIGNGTAAGLKITLIGL